MHDLHKFENFMIFNYDLQLKFRRRLLYKLELELPLGTGGVSRISDRATHDELSLSSVFSQLSYYSSLLASNLIVFRMFFL